MWNRFMIWFEQKFVCNHLYGSPYKGEQVCVFCDKVHRVR